MIVSIVDQSILQKRILQKSLCPYNIGYKSEWVDQATQKRNAGEEAFFFFFFKLLIFHIVIRVNFFHLIWVDY